MAPKKEAAGSSDGGTGTGTRCHGIALRAVKVFVATAAVSGTIWGLTSGGSVARNDAATLLMKSSKATKSPEMKSKAPKEPKGGKGEVSIKYDGVSLKLKGWKGDKSMVFICYI